MPDTNLIISTELEQAYELKDFKFVINLLRDKHIIFPKGIALKEMIQRVDRTIGQGRINVTKEYDDITSYFYEYFSSLSNKSRLLPNESAITVSVEVAEFMMEKQTRFTKEEIVIYLLTSIMSIQCAVL